MWKVNAYQSWESTSRPDTYSSVNLAQEPTGPASSSCDRMSTSRQRKLNSTLNQMALKTRPKRLKSAPRRSWRRFLAVSGGLLGRSWVPLGRFGTLRALLGVPPACLGPILEGFGMDLEVRAAKEEGIHDESSYKKLHSFPLQTLEDVVRTCRKNHSTKTSRHILQSEYWVVGTVAE